MHIYLTKFQIENHNDRASCDVIPFQYCDDARKEAARFIREKIDYTDGDISDLLCNEKLVEAIELFNYRYACQYLVEVLVKEVR